MQVPSTGNSQSAQTTRDPNGVDWRPPIALSTVANLASAHCYAPATNRAILRSIAVGWLLICIRGDDIDLLDNEQSFPSLVRISRCSERKRTEKGGLAADDIASG